MLRLYSFAQGHDSKLGLGTVTGTRPCLVWSSCMVAKRACRGWGMNQRGLGMLGDACCLLYTFWSFWSFWLHLFMLFGRMFLGWHSCTMIQGDLRSFQLLMRTFLCPLPGIWNWVANADKAFAIRPSGVLSALDAGFGSYRLFMTFHKEKSKQTDVMQQHGKVRNAELILLKNATRKQLSHCLRRRPSQTGCLSSSGHLNHTAPYPSIATLFILVLFFPPIHPPKS